MNDQNKVTTSYSVDADLKIRIRRQARIESVSASALVSRVLGDYLSKMETTIEATK